jgi:hypothetical protein
MLVVALYLGLVRTRQADLRPEYVLVLLVAPLVVLYFAFRSSVKR